MRASSLLYSWVVRPLSSGLLGATALLLGAGCTGPVEGGYAGDSEAPKLDGVHAETAQVHAYLSVDRSREQTGTERITKEVASASFLRTRDGSDPTVVARLVGVMPDLPAAGACAVLDDSQAPSSVPLRTLSPVEMVHVGEVSLGNGHEGGGVQLVPRAYPDVAHLLSGVVYTSSGAEGLQDREKAHFRVSGAGDVPGFEIDLPMPRAIEALWVNDVLVGGEAAEVPQGSGGGVLEVRWAGDAEGTDAASAKSEITFVDAVIENASGPMTKLRCATHDASVVLAGVRPEAGLTMSLAVHRLRTVVVSGTPVAAGPAIELAGMPAGMVGEVRLDAALMGRAQIVDPG